MTLSRTLVPIACGAALAAAGCGSSSAARSSSSSDPASSSTASPGAAASGVPPRAARVLISGYAFRPATITVAPGARVTFTNRDQTNHTATSSSGAFDTRTIGPGASRTVILKRPGTYTYLCQFHAFMKATVVVK
ncbi:MAG TPA: cupredoxin domain-containing protein [Solirubrobacteraceae bacterium]